MTMMNQTRIVLEESNVISLRTALVMDDEDILTLSLNPALTPAPTKNIYKVEFKKWNDACFIYLYRYMRSADEEAVLAKNKHSWERDIKPISFDEPPKLRLQWSDSGNSVALFLNGEQWAFFEEETKIGYTKGILNSSAGNLWNQELFEKTFLFLEVFSG